MGIIISTAECFKYQIRWMWKYIVNHKRPNTGYQKRESHSVLSDSLRPHGLVHGILQARILEWVAFPFSRGSSQPRDWTQISHIAICYQLSHKGSPRILEWVAYPFSNRSSRPRNRTRVSCIAGRFFTKWAMGKPFFQITNYPNVRGVNILLSFLTHITDLSHKTNVNVKWIVILKCDCL